MAGTTKAKSTGSTATEAPGVKSARRAVELIEALAGTHEWLNLSDLHQLTGFPRSSLHGLVRTLQDTGWVETDRAGTAYRLGVRALTAGTAYLDHDPSVPYATQTLENIRATSGFTAHFARRFGTSVVYLETRESRQSTMLISRVGRTLPAYATALGKALLAELTDDEIAGMFPAKLPPLTKHTVPTRDALIAQCAQIREEGYALETEEGTTGVRCAAAVIPYRIPASDAISCSMPIDSASDADVKRVAGLLVEATTELGRSLRSKGIR